MRDLPRAKTHGRGAGHIALQDKFSGIASMIHDFLDRKIGDGAR